MEYDFWIYFLYVCNSADVLWRLTYKSYSNPLMPRKNLYNNFWEWRSNKKSLTQTTYIELG